MLMGCVVRSVHDRGRAAGVLDFTVRYSNERVAFGKADRKIPRAAQISRASRAKSPPP